MTWLSILLRSVSQSSKVQGNPWLVNLSPVCVNSWIGLTSIKELRKTNNKVKVRLRLSLRRGRISGRTDTIISNQRETLLGNLELPILRQLMLCSKNQCARYWKRWRMSRSSNGQIRWQEIPWDAIRAFIAITTKTRDTPPEIAGTYGITWTSWSERENTSNTCTTLAAKRAR